MEVDIRTIPGIDHVAVREQVTSYVGVDIANVEPFVDLNSVWTDPDHPWVQRIYDITGDHLGGRAEVAALPFFTDAAVLQPAFGGVPTVILGPGDTHMAHQTDEYCDIARIPVAQAMYESIIEDWYNTT